VEDFGQLYPVLLVLDGCDRISAQKDLALQPGLSGSFKPLCPTNGLIWSCNSSHLNFTNLLYESIR